MKQAFLAVIALILIALIGAQIPGFQYLFGVVIPYVAFAIFLGGFVYRVLGWAKSPVPFPITTTAGQGFSLPWVKQDKLDCPVTTSQVLTRMALEIFTFRSLFRNTKTSMYDGPKVTYESSKWLWLFGIMFHYSFLVIVVRHMLRLFTNPMPALVTPLEYFDGILQVGVPQMYISDAVLVLALLALFGRRLINSQVRYISLANDYFPLFLIFAIAVTGILMRYFIRVDVISIKQLAVGLASFSPTITGEIGAIFFVHLFLVCTLMAYFPFSKLMHLGGIFMSPTRNLANKSRMVRHVNPWNDPNIKPHSYAGYEDEFREFMVNAGLPVEKPLEPKSEEAPVE
jgi:nitrate reductase gamma subunit